MFDTSAFISHLTMLLQNVNERHTKFQSLTEVIEPPDRNLSA